MARRTAKPRLLTKAFTLIELMIVVSIVAVLAVLAVVGYRKLVLAAHTSEATHMVQSIRTAEESYHAEAQTYVSTAVNPGDPTQLYPTGNNPPGAWKTPWTTPTGTCADPLNSHAVACWALLPVHSDGPVMYGYATLAGPAGSGIGSVTLPNGVVLTTSGGGSGGGGGSPVDWYWISALGNPSGHAPAANYSMVVGNSFTNDLYVQDANE
jgi:type IV pilus assembly protein PilA